MGIRRFGVLEWLALAAVLVGVAGFAWMPGAVVFEVVLLAGLLVLGLLSVQGKRPMSATPLPVGMSDADQAAVTRIRRQGRLLLVPMLAGIWGALSTNWAAGLWGAYRQPAAAVFILLVLVSLVPAVLLRRRHFAIVDRYTGASAQG